MNTHNTPNRITLLLNDISGSTVSTLYSEGGGIRASQAANLEVGLNTINENTASDYGEGGGVALYESAGLVQWNWFLGNRATNGDGGGLSARYGSTGLALRGNWFEGNSAQDGGGLNIAYDAVALVDANTVVSNTAGLGAGIHLVVGGSDADEPSRAEGDEDHWIIWDGSGGVRRYPTVYRGRRVWQEVNVGAWIGLVPEPEGMTHLVEQLSWRRFHRCFSPTRVDLFRSLLYNVFT